MEIEGKIVQILAPQTGTSAKGEWKKQEFIVETQEQYPRKVCVGVFNDKIPLSSFNEGAMVKVYVNVESREFNGKWYTNINGWKIELQGEGAAASAADMPPPPPVPPSSNAADDWNSAEDSSDDLPF